jgi:spore germination protein
MKSPLFSIIALLLLGAGVFLISIVSLQMLNRYQHSLLTPISSTNQAMEEAAPSTMPTTQKKVILGFLPYWTIKTAQIPTMLTNVGYFSISIDKNGNFVTKQDNYTEPGWHTYNSPVLDQLRATTTAQHQKLEVLLTMMNADDISTFLQSPAAQQTFQTNLRQFVHSQPIDGINIDFEYVGDVTDQLRTEFTTFISDSSQTVHSLDPSAEFSIDVVADSSVRKHLIDIPAVVPFVDHIVAMTYDYYAIPSANSGPVAPVFGSEKNRWNEDIVTDLKSMIQQAPPEKILLGIPFYGYEWRTTSVEPGSPTYPRTGQLATYQRVENLIASQNIQEQWDPDALSPFLNYKIGERIQTIFYENSRSLSYKLDLVNHAQLGGIAIWALGYEGNTQELWDVIEQKL